MLVFGMARPKTLTGGMNQTFCLDDESREILKALRNDNENASETLRRLLKEYAAAVLG